MCIGCNGRSTALECVTVRAEGDARPLPWVARFVARTHLADGAVEDRVLLETDTLLGHFYMAKAVYLHPWYWTRRIERFDLNWSLTFPSEKEEADYAVIGFDPCRISGALEEAAAGGAEIHLVVAGSPIGDAPTAAGEAPWPGLGWLSEAAWRDRGNGVGNGRRAASARQRAEGNAADAAEAAAA